MRWTWGFRRRTPPTGLRRADVAVRIEGSGEEAGDRCMRLDVTALVDRLERVMIRVSIVLYIYISTKIVETIWI